MKSVRIAAVVLLLVWCAAPAMACLVPQTLTAEESRCCKRMAGACSQSAAKHSCCKRVQPQDAASMTAKHSLVLAALPPVTLAASLTGRAVIVPLPVAFFSPPHSPPAITSILRI